MSKQDRRYAIGVCLFIFLSLGFAGWYENYQPVPQPSVEQMMAASDREVERNLTLGGGR